MRIKYLVSILMEATGREVISTPVYDNIFPLLYKKINFFEIRCERYDDP